MQKESSAPTASRYFKDGGGSTMSRENNGT